MVNLVDTVLVGEACSEYNPENVTAAPDNFGASCENCRNWDGRSCSIDAYDKVMMSLDKV